MAEQLTGVVRRNIEALTRERALAEERRPWSDRIADGITRFTGSMTFVFLHLAAYGGWIVINSGRVGVKPFDPFPFVMLAMVASVEAIFLSTFVLISQNRQARLAERRAELDLQISLLAEHEITRLVERLEAVAEHLGVAAGRALDVDELKEDVAPEAVLQALDQAEDGPAR